MEKSEKQKVQVAQSLRSLHRSLGDSRIKLLLNQEDLESVSRHMVYLNYFQQAQLRSIRGYEKTIAELESVKNSRHKLMAQLGEEKVLIDQKKQKLVKQQSERKNG